MPKVEADEIRPLNAEIDLITRAHGSGMFTRGQTQVLSIATLGPMGDAQQLDGLDEQINYASLKAQAIESLKSSLNSKNEELVGKLDKIADVLAYAALGACYHFDKSLEILYSP